MVVVPVLPCVSALIAGNAQDWPIFWAIPVAIAAVMVGVPILIGAKYCGQADTVHAFRSLLSGEATDVTSGRRPGVQRQGFRNSLRLA